MSVKCRLKTALTRVITFTLALSMSISPITQAQKYL